MKKFGAVETKLLRYQRSLLDKMVAKDSAEAIY